jgi:decaprenylphospho-beta-D-ribofuranose 2-oxidase
VGKEPDWPSELATLTSFDGSFTASVRHYAPDRYSFWDHGIAAVSRGAGVSYVPASFARDTSTVSHRHFNRILDFDTSSGIVEVETGLSLGQLYNFAVPHGYFLAVQPGHPKISVGGCIGADIHGKNQFRDGTFISQVQSLRLFHPAHGIIELSRLREPDLFHLTCGGFGLSGNILSARLRLSKFPGAYVTLRVHPVADVFKLPTLLRELQFSDLLYSWHDFLGRGERFGRGFVISGRFVPNSESEGVAPTAIDFTSRLDSSSRGTIPFPLLNYPTASLVNAIQRQMFRMRPSAAIPLHEFLFPVFNKSFYFGLFGKRGFHECQLVIPDNAFVDFMREVRTRLGQRRVPVTLASGKLFAGERDRLRFTGNGICFAFNFPRCHAGSHFAQFLDSLLIEFRAWPNLIKDSRLTHQVVRAAYPEYERFCSELSIFDPQRLYQSELSRRLGI